MTLFRFFIAIFVTLSVFSIGTAQTILSVRDFIGGPDYSKMAISPGGKYIAYVENRSGDYCKGNYERTVDNATDCESSEIITRRENDIIVYDLEQEKQAKLIKVPVNTFVGWLEFGTDNKLLASIVTPGAYTIRRNTIYIGGARVVSVSVVDKDPRKSETVVLFENEKRLLQSNLKLANITSLLPNDPEHILMPAQRNDDTDLWKVNIFTGDAERIEKGKSGTFFWYTDQNGKPVFRYDCSSRCRKIKIYAPVEGKDKWEKIREFKIKADDGFDDFDFLPVAPTDNPTQFYVISQDKSDPRRSVKIYDIATKEFVSVAYENPKYDVNGAVSDPGNGSYIGASYYEDRLHYNFEDPELQTYFKRLDNYFNQQANIKFLGWNSSRTKIVIYVTAPNNSGTYYLYDVTAKSVSEIIESRPDLQKGLRSEARVLQIPTRDGQTIAAYHYYPRGQMTGKPLIVLPHGGPHVRDYYDYDAWVQYFVHQGYQVVQMNFRGSDGYGREFEEAGYEQWGGLMQNDVTDTVKYFHSRGIASPEKTCIVGYSYGGYAALYGGATTPDLYKCVVSGGGVSNLFQTLKDDKEELNEENYELILASIGDPKINETQLFAKSPEFLAAQFDDPVLILHGTEDDRVKYHQAEKMNAALEAAGKDVVLVPLNEAGHANWSQKTTALYLETIIVFLEDHIGRKSN